MPLYEYLCNYCGHQFEELVYSKDPDDNLYVDCRCGSKAKKIPSAFGMYTGDLGSASTRPKQAATKAARKQVK